MSTRHPIIAVTGSSGAGTTTVMNSFQHIFRREKINAQIERNELNVQTGERRVGWVTQSSGAAPR